MLVLSRKQGESIVIAGNIVVTVRRASPGRVSLEIEAPQGVGIYRQELLDRPRPQIYRRSPRGRAA